MGVQNEGAAKWFTKGVTAGELVGYIITILIIVGSAWKNIDTRLTILEQQQIKQNEDYNDIKTDLRSIKYSMDIR